jgi:hypothetical protein
MKKVLFYHAVDGEEYKEVIGHIKTSTGFEADVTCKCFKRPNNQFFMLMPIECEAIERRQLNDLVTLVLLKNPVIQQKRYTTDREVFNSIRHTGYRKKGKKVEVVRCTQDTRKPITLKINLAPVEELERMLNGVKIEDTNHKHQTNEKPI